MTYQGEEVLGDWGQAGPATSVVEIWHAPGGVTMAHAVAAAPHWSGEAPHIVAPASYLGGQALVGSVMLGMSPRLVALLSANYQVAAVGWAQVAGRMARVVTARRGGRLAARFWLDKVTMLPLRRETFDGHGHVVSLASFMALTVGTARPGRQRRRPPGSGSPSGRPGCGAGGWPLPGPTPGGLALLGARKGNTATGPVVDLDYSDGLSLVSVFLQRGHLRSRPAGWSRMALGGSQVYADDSERADVRRGRPGASCTPWSRRRRRNRGAGRRGPAARRQTGTARPAAARPAPAAVLVDPVIAAHGQGRRGEVAGAGHRGVRGPLPRGQHGQGRRGESRGRWPPGGPGVAPPG